MDLSQIVAFGGWILAATQFLFTHQAAKQKSESELLEKTLSYFERGTQARSIGISLVEGIWLKKKTKLEVILPVLISQANFLVTEAEDFGQESRNLIRLLFLIEKCLPYAIDKGNEIAEISEALQAGALAKKGVSISTGTLRSWYARFNNGDSSQFVDGTDS